MFNVYKFQVHHKYSEDFHVSQKENEVNQNNHPISKSPDSSEKLPVIEPVYDWTQKLQTILRERKLTKRNQHLQQGDYFPNEKRKGIVTSSGGLSKNLMMNMLISGTCTCQVVELNGEFSVKYIYMRKFHITATKMFVKQ